MKQVTFINYRLDASLLIICEDDLMHVDDWPEFHIELLNEGYKVSARYNIEQSSFSLYVTGTDKTPNEGLCLNAWHSSLTECYRRMQLMHVVIGKRKSWKTLEVEADEMVRRALRG